MVFSPCVGTCDQEDNCDREENGQVVAKLVSSFSHNKLPTWHVFFCTEIPSETFLFLCAELPQKNFLPFYRKKKRVYL